MFQTPKSILFAATAFSLACAGAYVHRGDYYHKQNDQFYYLSIADSLRAQGALVAHIDLAPEVPPTANTGAAWVMRPFSGMDFDHVMISVCVLYLLLHLTTIYPVFHLLLHLGLERKSSTRICLIYFLSFPVTLFSIWPVNEGPSLAMCAWFLYFLLVAPRGGGFIPIAFVAPVFRIHIVVFELASLIYAGIFKKRLLAWRAAGSVAASALGMGLYRLAFPFHQRALGGEWSGEQAAWRVTREVWAATIHLFVPETVISKLFGSYAEAGAVWGGAVLFSAICLALALNLKKRQEPGLHIFGASVFLITTVFLCFSLVIIARFFTPAYLWIIVALVVCAQSLKPLYATVLTRAWIGLNFTVLAAFAFGKSTDPQYELLEDLKALAPLAKGAPVVFYDKDFPVYNRPIYGYFRRPSGKWDVRANPQHFVYLSLKADSLPERFADCSLDRHEHGAMSLLNVDCPKELR